MWKIICIFATDFQNQKTKSIVKFINQRWDSLKNELGMKCVINLKMYNMKTNELSIYDEDYLKSKIYIIRGVQVMIDAL